MLELIKKLYSQLNFERIKCTGYNDLPNGLNTTVGEFEEYVNIHVKNITNQAVLQGAKEFIPIPETNTKITLDWQLQGSSAFIPITFEERNNKIRICIKYTV